MEGPNWHQTETSGYAFSLVFEFLNTKHNVLKSCDLGEILGVVSESEESFDDDLQHASLEAEKLAVDIEEFQPDIVKPYLHFMMAHFHCLMLAFFIAFLFSSINVALEARHLLDTAKASSKAPTLQVVPPVPKPKLPPLPPLPSILTSPPHASPESREPKKALSSPPSQLPPAPSSNTPTSPELPKPKIALSSPQPSQLAPAPSSTPPTSPEEPKPKKDVVSPPPSQLPPTPSSIAPTSPPQVPPSTSTSLTPTISPLAPPHPTFPKLILPPLPHLELPPLTKPILPKLPPLPSIIPPFMALPQLSRAACNRMHGRFTFKDDSSFVFNDVFGMKNGSHETGSQHWGNAVIKTCHGKGF
nr:vegetative cell wall protein gp1-like [Quercus suber]